MRDVIVHGHIFKNAGTTFDWALQRNFGDGFCDHRDDRSMLGGGMEYLREYLDTHPAIRALSSHHLPYSVDGEGIRFHRCYLIRHPIERARSAYRFERIQDAETRGARKAKLVDFAGYVSWRMQEDVPNTIRDFQVAYLAGQLRPPRAAAAERYSIASGNMEDACVGVVDRFDESMVVFEEQLADRGQRVDLAYVTQNVGDVGSAGAANRLDDVETVFEELGAVGELLHRENYLDLRLYHRAHRRLDASIGAIADFERKLAAFRDRCRRCAGGR